jgi:lipoprotein-releasing system permease protein
MKFSLINYISKKFGSAGGNRQFINFTRIVAFISVALGSVALILSLSILSGFEKHLLEKAVSFAAHITVRTFDREPIADPEKQIGMLKKEYPQIENAAAYIEKEALIRNVGFVDGIMIRGMVPGSDITGLSKFIDASGGGFSAPDAKEIIIGKNLARKLSAQKGSEVVLFALDISPGGGMPNPRASKFTVAGIYESGLSQYDDVLVLMPFQAAGEFFRMPPGHATNIEIMLKDVTVSRPISLEMDKFLGFPYFTVTMKDMHSHLFSWIEIQKEPIPLVLGLISVVAVMNIITALLVLVLEKVRSIGILRSLGMGKRELLRLFLVKGTMLGLTGSLTGSGLSLLFCILQQEFMLIRLKGDIYYLNFLPVDIIPAHYLAIIGLTTLLSLIATLVPAYIAVKISPVRALRFR